jgi:hypothetical protein
MYQYLKKVNLNQFDLESISPMLGSTIIEMSDAMDVL